ncbi:MAG: lysophospholipase L1-like esterase [Candidatus Latescibacterota bacterium]|jgi:lysophospholipase L1-like esterase
MPNVVLIGDSIRMGYEATVRAQLPNLDIWSPKQNGGDSRRIRENLDAWTKAHTPQIIHINCGLHDLKKDFETGTPSVPLEEYRKNVTHILTHLQKETEATLIWALTTPVNESWHHERKGFDRLEADVLSYNQATQEICNTLKIPVNDLYAVVNNAGCDTLLKPDGVHFNETGCDLLGKAVAQIIQSQI